MQQAEWPPKDNALIPGNCAYVMLYSKRDSAYISKNMELKWGDYPKLSRWDQTNEPLKTELLWLFAERWGRISQKQILSMRMN